MKEPDSGQICPHVVRRSDPGSSFCSRRNDCKVMFGQRRWRRSAVDYLADFERSRAIVKGCDAIFSFIYVS